MKSGIVIIEGRFISRVDVAWRLPLGDSVKAIVVIVERFFFPGHRDLPNLAHNLWTNKISVRRPSACPTPKIQIAILVFLIFPSFAQRQITGREGQLLTFYDFFFTTITPLQHEGIFTRESLPVC
jgi:hypothetical protein